MAFAASRQSPDKVFLRVKVLKTNIEESSNALSERTTERPPVMPKQSETEVAHGLGRIFAEFKYDVAKISGGLITS